MTTHQTHVVRRTKANNANNPGLWDKGNELCAFILHSYVPQSYAYIPSIFCLTISVPATESRSEVDRLVFEHNKNMFLPPKNSGWKKKRRKKKKKKKKKKRRRSLTDFLFHCVNSMRAYFFVFISTPPTSLPVILKAVLHLEQFNVRGHRFVSTEVSPLVLKSTDGLLPV